MNYPVTHVLLLIYAARLSNVTLDDKCMTYSFVLVSTDNSAPAV